MISEVRIENFKRFQNQTFTFKPDGVTFLAGGNNSGKTTLLHALALWEFCRAVVQQDKGEKALLSGYVCKPSSVSLEDFSPVALPDLRHLWHNLRTRTAGQAASYNLKICCTWPSPTEGADALQLEFALTLSGDRLFFKCSHSNLLSDSLIPRMAYLPTFAGIASSEERLSPAMRKHFIGRGAAGAVLRNTLYDLWHQSQESYDDLRSSSGRVSPGARSAFKRTDPWELLLDTVHRVFGVGLTVQDFNEALHTRLRVGLHEVELLKEYRKKPGAVERDIMVEGSGLLQWLSVYALAVREDLDLLLLDEPDAHLHPSLQGFLTDRLRGITVSRRKQVLLATHSTTILGEAKPNEILWMQNAGASAYLAHEGERVALFLGLGSVFSPLIDRLKHSRKLFLYEGPSDIVLLKLWAEKLGLDWPSNMVEQESKHKSKHEDRTLWIKTLHQEIPALKTFCIVDRDERSLKEISRELVFNGFKKVSGTQTSMWRRRNIEGYLLVPRAIAEACQVPEEEIVKLLHDFHGIAVPINSTAWNCPDNFGRVNGKDAIGTYDTAKGTPPEPNTILAVYGVDYAKIAACMRPEEIGDDVKTLIRQIQAFAQS
jgi:hypothetical protein